MIDHLDVNFAVALSHRGTGTAVRVDRRIHALTEELNIATPPPAHYLQNQFLMHRTKAAAAHNEPLGSQNDPAAQLRLLHVEIRPDFFRLMMRMNVERGTAGGEDTNAILDG